MLAILATWPQAQRRALASLICERAYGVLGGTATSLDLDERSSLEWVLTLAEQHPDDPLVVARLLLRLFRLQPGQPIYLPSGVPHAYLSGVGLEIMASSEQRRPRWPDQQAGGQPGTGRSPQPGRRAVAGGSPGAPQPARGAVAATRVRFRAVPYYGQQRPCHPRSAAQ